MAGSVISSTLDEGMAGVLFPQRAPLDVLPEEDARKAKMLWQMLMEAKRWKAQTPYADAEINWDYWEGKQWERQRAPGYSMCVINMIYEMVETFNGHVMDNIQESVARSRKPQYQEVAQTLTKLLGWCDDINSLRSQLDIITRSAECAGFSAFRVDWSDKMDRWRGAPQYNFIDEANFFVSPWARDRRDLRYIIEARNVPLESLVGVWEKAKNVPLGVQDQSLTPLRSLMGREPGGDYQAFSYGNFTQITQGGLGRQGQKDLVTFMDAWIRDPETDAIKRIVCANGVILDEGPSPYDDEEFPHVILNLIPSKHSVYGYPPVSFVRKLNRDLNEMYSYGLDQQKYESDSPMVVSSANATEGKTFTNMPGSVYIDADPKKQGYYLLNKQGANPRWLDMQEMAIKRIRDIAGDVQILRGERPAGVTTLGAMEILRDEASVLVKKMMLHMQRAIREKDLLVIARLRQFFKDDRVVRITGKGNREEHVRINERSGYDLRGEPILKNDIPEDFEADIDFTPMPPGGIQARLERDHALLQAGVVDQQFVLQDLEFDQADVEGLMERIAQQQEAAAKMEMAKTNPELVAEEEDPDPDEMAQAAMAMFGGAAA